MSLQTTIPRVESTKLGEATGTCLPKRTDEERRCWCGTKLNAYNLGDACYLHSGRRFPRVRGRPS